MVRHEAAEALGGIATDDCLPVLEEMSKKEGVPRVVRESCEVALDMVSPSAFLFLILYRDPKLTKHVVIVRVRALRRFTIRCSLADDRLSLIPSPSPSSFPAQQSDTTFLPSSTAPVITILSPVEWRYLPSTGVQNAMR